MLHSPALISRISSADKGQTARDSVSSAYDALKSKELWRNLLYAAFIGAGSAILYGFAVLAYLLFYHNFLPDQVLTVPIHLQYG